MRLTLEAKDLVAKDTVRLRLVASDARTLPRFAAGAHVELEFASYRRRYSLTSTPADTLAYEVIVLRARSGRGGSAFIHDRFQPGDTVTVSTPINGFTLDPVARQHVFIAGGIGLTPFYTMAEEVAASGRIYQLHYVVRSPARMLPVDAFGPHVTVYAGTAARRALSLPVLLGSLSRTTAVYGCGPSGLLEGLRAIAVDLGWPAGRLRVETFGPAARPNDRPLTVQLSQSGVTVDVAPGTSILDALLRQGIFVGAECRRGECGACIVDVVDGDVDHRDVCLTPAQRRNAMCTCVSWARTSDITLAL